MHHLIYDENFHQNIWSEYCCFSLVTDEETKLRKKLRGKEQAAPGEWTAMGFDSRHLMSGRSSHSVSLVLISVPKITDGHADWTAYLMLSFCGLKKEGLTLSILYLLLGFQPFDLTQCHVAWPGSQPAHPTRPSALHSFQWITYLYRDQEKGLANSLRTESFSHWRRKQ